MQVAAALCALDYKPDQAPLDVLDARLDVLELVEKARLAELAKTGADPFDAEAARQVREDVRVFKQRLAETADSITGVRTELAVKASAPETTATLKELRAQLVALARTAVGRPQLLAAMQSKIDRSDLHAIALQIANGELEGLHPAVAAKLQIPDFRCLCCDRPLPSSAVLSTSSVSLPGASMTPASSANCLHALPKQLPHLDANSEDLYSRDDTHANKPNRADAEPHRRQRSAPTHPQYVMDESVTATVAPATNADSQSTFSRYPRLMPPKHLKPATKYRLN